MRSRLGASALSLSALLLSPSAGAQDEAAIVVSATRFAEVDPRVPATVSVITRDDIRATPALDLPALLRTRAGVDVRTLYGSLGIDAAVDLRGFGDTAGSNTLVLLDGQRINPIDMGSIGWSAIPLESIRRIEIIRGAGTVLYGDRASGGVINIISDKSGKPRAAVTATGGSAGHRALDAHGAGGNEQGYANLFVHAATADGWRQNSQQDQQSVSGRAGRYLGAGEAFVDFAGYQDSAGLPGYLRRADYQADPRRSTTPADRQKRDGYRLRPGIMLHVSDSLALEAELAAEKEDQHADYASFGSVSDRAKEMLSFTPRLKLRHGFGGLASETVIGFDYYAGRVDARYSAAPRQTARQTSTALYLQHATSLDASWRVTLGGRSQRMDQRASQEAYAAWFSPALEGSAVRTRGAWDVGASYDGAGWRGYGKLGTTYRFANTDELFGFDPILFVPVFAGDLRPQHGSLGEIGGSFSAGPVGVRAALYRMNLRDEIGYDGAVGTNTNFAPTRRQGIEVEADWRVGERLKARLAYARTDAEFRSGAYAGRRMPLVPRDKATLQLIWDAGRAGAYSAIVHAVGARPYSGDFDNVRDRLAGYTTLDLQGTWNLKPWSLTARVLNAFDKRYAPFAGYSPSIADYYYYPADGRGIHVSARYDFR